MNNKFRKILALSALSLLMCNIGLAQDVKFGIKGGENISSLMAGDNNTPVSEGYKSLMTKGGGIFTELQINPTVSLRLGVEYIGMGGKKDGMQAIPSQRLITEMGNSIGMSITEQQLAALGALAMNMPPYYYANVDNTVKLDYVMIPLMAQFGKNIGQSPWRVYINAGPFVSFLMSGKQESKGTSKMFADASGTQTLWEKLNQPIKDMVASEFPSIESTLDNPATFGKTNITGELKSSNFGVTGNAGIRYQCRKNYLFIEAGGNYGFATVQDNNTNGSNRTGAVSVMIGYSFSLF